MSANFEGCCGACRFSNLTTFDPCSHEPDAGIVIAYECRRYPPQTFVVAENDAAQSWPTMQAEDWCGEFAERTEP